MLTRGRGIWDRGESRLYIFLLEEAGPFLGPVFVADSADELCALIEESVIGWRNKTGAENRAPEAAREVRIAIFKGPVEQRIGPGHRVFSGSVPRSPICVVQGIAFP